MSYDINRPFIIIPKLILQPTWGGSYIINAKNLGSIPGYADLIVGQSYELFSGSKLSLTINDTRSSSFIPELGNPDTDDTLQDNPLFYAGSDHVVMSEAATEHKDKLIGPGVWSEHQKMPLLIKLTQALGNSFQLHVKSGMYDEHWLPKPESWYYLEDGAITFGLKHGTSLNTYKQTCHEIANHMAELSQLVRTGQTDIKTARQQAKTFISAINPWQYVNKLNVSKGDLIDLSGGGLHHSWEEDPDRCPQGNVVYEVQHDVMDPVSTIRSFDQGKIKDDGTIRTIHIDDYFRFIDTDEEKNNPESAFRQKHGETLLATSFYNLDELHIAEERHISIENSFEHLYVMEGSINITTHNTTVTVSQGHSAFIPYSVEEYTLTPMEPSIILRTYISSK